MVRIGEYKQELSYLTDEENRIYEFKTKEEAKEWLTYLKNTMTEDELNKNYVFEEIKNS